MATVSFCMANFIVGERVGRNCWPENVGTVRAVVSDAHLPGATNPNACHLKVEWDDKPGELFEEWPRDLHNSVTMKPALSETITMVAYKSVAKASSWPSLRRDRVTGRAWLSFPSKPAPEVVELLKAAGWRWSGYRRAWHNPRKGVTPPLGIPFQDDGLCDYNAERADRLDVAAGNAQERSNTAYRKAQRTADGIPLGQPILIGHHSEKRARRDLQRIRAGFEKAFEEQKTANELNRKADASREHREHLESAPVIQRRLDKLRAELRSIDAREAQWGLEHRVDWQTKRDRIQAEVTQAEAALAGAGGPIVTDCKPGDIVRIKGRVVKVDRVSLKSIRGTIVEGGAKGMTGKWNKSYYQGKVGIIREANR